MKNLIDPIKFEVIRNALTEATEEMAVALRRSAYSTNVKTRQDFSCAFFDKDLRVIAQAFTQPVHLGSFVELVPKAITKYGVSNILVDDMLVVNDPYSGGVHLNDITLIAPAHYRGKLVGYMASLAHHVDVGGGAPASIGAFREVFQEGIIIPPVKLVSGGIVDEDIFSLILAQIRSKRETAGDFKAQMAANNAGKRRLNEIVDRYGIQEFTTYQNEIIDYTHRRTLAELGKLPQGVFQASGFVDTDGYTPHKVNLKVEITINNEGVNFDTTGSDPQRRAPVNSTYAQTFSACAYALRCLLDPDLPVNHGFYEFVKVNATEGTVTNCTSPAPVVGGWETHVRLNDLIFKALSSVIKTSVPAGTKAMQCHAGFGGIVPETGEYYCFLETIAGGYGGRFQSDGPDAVQSHGQNTENAPIEETESNYPVRILRYELIPDSEGAGRQRGGLGLRRDYTFLHNDVTFTVLADRDKAGPWGLFGGEAGLKAQYLLIKGSDTEILDSKVTLHLDPGDVISYRTCGGGGYGPPVERAPKQVLDDFIAGKISLKRALDTYKVVIHPELKSIDLQATLELRGGTKVDA